MATLQTEHVVCKLNVLIGIEVKPKNIRICHRFYYTVPLLHRNVLPTLLAQVKMLVACLREASGSTLDQDTDYPI